MQLRQSLAEYAASRPRRLSIYDATICVEDQLDAAQAGCVEMAGPQQMKTTCTIC
jgi:hypothetical protein